MVGTTIGSYRVLEKLGEGGMGQVYRARDTSLEREVAIKVLPESFASDADRLMRFEREARTLAALNHPNIAHVHGIEEAGGTPALVMELVGGDDLSARIARGPIPLDEALPIARQMAEALEAAHRAGIVHRDLKPANVKVRPDGTVKVLDFGLAKVDAPASAGVLAEGATTQPGSPGLSLVVTSPAVTAAGIVLGTAAYMAPEQARGMPVDARADIWSFGAVLFEMITGKRAFEGDLTSDVLASVLRDQPSWQALPSDTPPAVRRLLHRCLEKDPRRRVQAIGDARIEIEDAISGGPASAPAVSQPPSTMRSSLVPWAVAATAAAAALVMLWQWSPWRAAPEKTAVRVRVDLGADVGLVTANTGAAAILSPDGALLAFVGRPAGTVPSQLFLRRLSQLDATMLAGTDDANNPFFSADGQWIGFFTADKLKKVAITGGAAVTLADARNARGGSWTADGSIIFAENRSGLFRVAAAGGARAPLTTLGEGEVTHRHPQVLPGGRSVLYTAHTGVDDFDNAYLVVQSLVTGTRSVIHRGGYAGRYLPSGQVVYIRDGTLFALPFDLDRLAVTGSPAPVLEGVTVSAGRGEAQFAVSEDGALVYFPVPGAAAAASMFWIDRQGQSSVLRSAPSLWMGPEFAPDGHRLVMTVGESQRQDIWIHDWKRDVLTRLTLDPAGDVSPVWAPDGRGIAFASTRGQALPNLYWQRADGSGEAHRLTNSPNWQAPSSWHPSGRFLAFTEWPSGGPADVMILPLDGNADTGWKSGTASAFESTRFREAEARFSPDGRWIAYESDEGGGLQVYVRPFPGPGPKLQMSTSGGQDPRWSRSQRELLFHDLDGRIMVAPYTATGDAFAAERARPWTDVRFAHLARGFDLHPDGDRLAVPPLLREEDARRDQVVLIFNVLDEFERATAKK